MKTARRLLGSSPRRCAPPLCAHAMLPEGSRVTFQLTAPISGVQRVCGYIVGYEGSEVVVAVPPLAAIGRAYSVPTRDGDGRVDVRLTLIDVTLLTGVDADSSPGTSLALLSAPCGEALTALSRSISASEESAMSNQPTSNSGPAAGRRPSVAFASPTDSALRDSLAELKDIVKMQALELNKLKSLVGGQAALGAGGPSLGPPPGIASQAPAAGGRSWQTVTKEELEGEEENWMFRDGIGGEGRGVVDWDLWGLQPGAPSSSTRPAAAAPRPPPANGGMDQLLELVRLLRGNLATAYTVQASKAVLQASLDGGSWESASLLWPFPDPLGGPEFGGQESEMQAVLAYRRALTELRSKSKVGNEGTQPQGDSEESGHPPAGNLGGGRRPKGGGRGKDGGPAPEAK